MLGSNIEIFFGKFAIYIIAAIMALAAFLGAGWYVSNVRLEGQRNKADGLYSQLQSSNSALANVKEQYKALTTRLEANQQLVIGNQETIKAGIKQANEKNNGYLALEDMLKDRTPKTDCQTPEDLKDAWSKL